MLSLGFLKQLHHLSNQRVEDPCEDFEGLKRPVTRSQSISIRQRHPTSVSCVEFGLFAGTCRCATLLFSTLMFSIYLDEFYQFLVLGGDLGFDCQIRYILRETGPVTKR